MSVEEIAKRCYVKIAANNGFFHEEYFVGCIVEAIGEALAAQQSVQPTLLRCDFTNCQEEVRHVMCSRHYDESQSG